MRTTASHHKLFTSLLLGRFHFAGREKLAIFARQQLSNIHSAFHEVPAGQRLAAAAASNGKKVVDGRLGDEELLRAVNTVQNFQITLSVLTA